MGTPNRHSLLAAVIAGARWTTEYKRATPKDRVAGRAARQAESKTTFSVDLGDRTLDPDRAQGLRLQFESGEELHVLVVDRPTPRSLVVRTDRPAPADAAELIYTNDPTFLLEALRDALADIEPDDNDQAAAVMEGRLAPAPTTANSCDDLNAEQELALAAIWAPGTQVIWGPPGTGKTQVIAEALRRAVNAELTVLLVSNANVAVDQALLRAYERVKPTDGVMVRNGTPQMRGVVGHPALDLDQLERTIVRGLRQKAAGVQSEIDANAGEPKRVRLHEAQARLAELDPARVRAAESRLANERQAAELGDRLADAKQAVEQAEATAGAIEQTRDRALADGASDVGTTWRDIDAARQELAAARDATTEQVAADAVAAQALSEAVVIRQQTSRWRRKERSAAKLAVATAKGQLTVAVQRLQLARDDEQETSRRIGRRIDQLQRRLPKGADEAWWRSNEEELSRSEAELPSARDAVSASRAERDSIEARLSAARAELPTDDDRRLVVAAATIDRAELEQKTRDLQADVGQLDEQRRRLDQRKGEFERQLAGVRSELLREASVVATTLAALPLNRELLKRRFDIVLIDEASACSLAAVVLAASLSRRSLTLIGDFCQLGPVMDPSAEAIAKADEPPSPQVSYWLTTEVFTHLGIDSAQAANGKAGCVTLTRQYRFGAEVQDLVNELVYKGTLLAGSPVAPPADGLGEIVLIDTSKLLGARVEQEGKSRRWAPGVALTLALLERHRGETVGIVTPYAAQAAKLEAVVSDLAEPGVEAGTVHRFQGRQFDTVIFDMVSTSRYRSNVEYQRNDESGPLFSGQRLTNVALTRTTGRIYLIGDVSSSADPGMSTGFFDSIRRRVEQGRIGTIDASDLLDDLHLGSGDSRRVELGPTGGGAGTTITVLTNADFRKRFEDLLASASKLEVWSPFYNERRLTELETQLRAGRIRVEAVVRRPKSERERRVFERLIALVDGVSCPNDTMHEKLVIADGDIVLWGSLNAFQTGGQSSEIMTELRSPALAVEMRSVASRR